MSWGVLLLCLSFRRQFFCFVLFFILSFLKERSVLFCTLKGCVGFYIIFFSKEWSSCRRGFVVLLDNPSSCRIRFQRKIIISQEIELLKERECWSSAHQGNQATLFHSPRAWSRSKCSSCCGLCSCKGPWSRSTRPALIIFYRTVIWFSPFRFWAEV